MLIIEFVVSEIVLKEVETPFENVLLETKPVIAPALNQMSIRQLVNDLHNNNAYKQENDSYQFVLRLCFSATSAARLYKNSNKANN